MKQLFLLCCFLASLASFSQNDEAYVAQLTSQFTQKLSERGIDQYFWTKHYCNGSIEMFQIDGKMCSSKGTYYEVYVFWEEEGLPMVKKIDNCGLYHSLELANNEVLYYAFENLDRLASEEVKHYKSETYTGTPELRKKVQPCFRSFYGTDGTTTFESTFNLFDISNDSDGKNLNYEYNHSLVLVNLNAQIESLLPTLTFTRQ
ncbi:MAG: hypothetical protein R2793_05490 [Flavobacteriaceae bacterium]